jgi:hypothetical protein
VRTACNVCHGGFPQRFRWSEGEVRHQGLEPRTR